MRWIWALSCLALLPTLPLLAARAEDGITGTTKAGGCVDVKGSASFASVGYDHIVTLKSECKKPMRCTVKTDVNPEQQQVDLDPGEEKSVVTWRGSPARVFRIDASCEERKAARQ